ncbi:Pantothenate synthetase [Anaerohalosphaera lusitana]|uniref:Pantothenate synthetase n=1 Tax=Anaerohalosphaera lusitana TaxID=1936003 RepID=A0A1U9NN27_9BACT|nr:pantoate--beta-alanine ligase [Anaerohalosphaera lusitana]AQT69010.1 Pantothenate synthetase [Anaerohalosphaera lusitana]
MRTLTTIEEMRAFVRDARSQGKSIGFVPTMGALHAGHLSLIRRAKEKSDVVVVSIFVNPTQFGPSEDLEAYPRDMAADQQKCRDEQVDAIFAPAVNEMYPQENLTWVNVESLTDKLCGRSRPGHFRGVTTVCTKLFNIVQPDYAFFGQKDGQQAIVIKRMVADLNMPLQIVVCDTVREPDGLAMSSRNKYLTPEQRQDAPLIYKSLAAARDAVDQGERSTEKVKQTIQSVLAESQEIEPEYINIVDLDTLSELPQIQGKALIAIAAKLGTARLIDNIIVDANTQK